MIGASFCIAFEKDDVCLLLCRIYYMNSFNQAQYCLLFLGCFAVSTLSFVAVVVVVVVVAAGSEEMQRQQREKRLEPLRQEPLASSLDT